MSNNFNNTSEEIKKDVRRYWNSQPCGTQFTKITPGSHNFFEEVTRFRYQTQPFMEELCKFKEFSGKKLLEIGCGLGTDLLQFAQNGALVTGVDLTENSVSLAKKRFELYGQQGEFMVSDAENLPFAENSFDVVYSFGVLHHTPNTQKSIDEVYRVLKPQGKIVIMLYHKHSIHTWLGAPLYFLYGLLKGKHYGKEDWIRIYDGVENPVGKAYTRSEIKKMFSRFKNISFKTCDPYRRRFPHVVNVINQKLFANWSGFWLMIYAEK